VEKSGTLCGVVSFHFAQPHAVTGIMNGTCKVVVVSGWQCLWLVIVCSNAVEMRNKFKDAFVKKHGVKLGFMSPFIKASAFALQDQPTVNAVIEGTEIIYRDFIDISVAVATPKVSCCTMMSHL